MLRDEPFDWLPLPPWQQTKPSVAADAALFAWLKYEVDCERYDRLVCTGGIGPAGGILPRDHFERSLINRFARVRRRWLNEELARHEVPEKVADDAQRYVQRMTYEEQERLLAQRESRR